MKMITDGLVEWTPIIKKEIENDSYNDYFWPVTKKHKIFEQAYMKFLNRNLNYFHFPNMVVHAAIEGNEFNKAFPKTIEFCEHVRALTNNTGPFGRMCIWYIPPGRKLLPHTDNFEYHRNMVRNIFVISENHDRLLKINIGNIPVKFNSGTLFQFHPDRELHEFINDTNENFYFLGFDYWIPELLDDAVKNSDISGVLNDTSRLEGFGGPGTTYKYISKH
jgi:hypothetical protein